VSEQRPELTSEQRWQLRKLIDEARREEVDRPLTVTAEDRESFAADEGDE
jgi:hypothetical protein